MKHIFLYFFRLTNSLILKLLKQKYSIAIPLYILLPITTSAQPINEVLYLETVGGEKRELPISITSAYDGGFVVGILSDSETGTINTSCALNLHGRMTFRKYDPSGNNLEWEICSPTYKYKYLFPTEDTGLVYIGSSWEGTGPNDRDFLCKKTDKNGTIIWDKTYGGTRSEQLRKVIATSDKGYILVGETASEDGDVGPNKAFSEFDADIWVIKIDSLGNKVWTRLLEGSEYEWAADVVEGQDGTYYVLGSTASGDYDCDCAYAAGKYYDMYLAKLDNSGNVIWRKCYGNSVINTQGKGIIQDGVGGFYLTAATSGNGRDVIDFKGKTDIWLIHIDSSGKILWSTTYGSANYYERPNSICRTADGNIWIAGYSEGKDGQVTDAVGQLDAWILKISPTGTLLSSRVLGTTEIDEANCIHPLNNNSVIVTGMFGAAGVLGSIFPDKYYGGTSDAFIARLATWYVSIQDEITEPITLYPNPVTEKLFIRNKNQEPIRTVVRDISGRIIYQSTAIDNITVDVSSWNRGLYLCEIFNLNSSQSYQYKLIVN